MALGLRIWDFKRKVERVGFPNPPKGPNGFMLGRVYPQYEANIALHNPVQTPYYPR